jgi:transposase-like protein
LNPICAYFAIADAEIHALVSNGRRGKQKIRYWKCQACGGCRTSRYGTPLYWLKTPLSHVTMVMTALSEGVDISACVRIFENHHPTITRWLMRGGQHSQRLHERLFHQAVQVGHLQLDELVTKVKREAERLWLWTAVAAQSNLILAFHLGRRSTSDAQYLLHQVWQRLVPDCLPISLPAMASTNISTLSLPILVPGTNHLVPENITGFPMFACNMLNYVNAVRVAMSLSFTSSFVSALGT